MSVQVWFYEKDRKPEGPVSEAELWELLNSGVITKESLVWKEPMEKWLPFSEVPELRIAPRPKPPPIPEPEQPPAPKEPAFEAPPAPEPDPEETIEHVEKVVFKQPEYQGGDTTTMDAAEQQVSQQRPWVRFLARMVDYYIFTMLVLLLLGFMFPGFIEQFSQSLSEQTTLEEAAIDYQIILFEIILRIIVTFVWVFLEAYTISKYGTTFGKNLLGTKVVDKNGELLSYDRALKRSYSVWLKGMGAGFMLISWLTMLFGYQTLKRNGESTWDEEADSKVVHTYFSPTRIIVILSLFLLMIFLAFGSLR